MHWPGIVGSGNADYGQVRLIPSLSRGSQAKLSTKNIEYSGHSERSAAWLRILAAQKERFFTVPRMTTASLLIAFWYYSNCQKSLLQNSPRIHLVILSGAKNLVFSVA
jgi:hypothetical protein